jgi:hypothetical protein
LYHLCNELPGERVNDWGRNIALFPLAMNEEWSRFLHWKTRRIP